MSLFEFFVYKNATRVDDHLTMKRRCVYFIIFCAALLFVDVYKKKTSDPKEFLGYPTLGRDP